MDIKHYKNINIDKSDWKSVKFGDVVKEIRESLKDPASQGLDRIVGLEHIEPENIHLRKWAPLTEGTTFIRRFRKGQVLFGRRRAYLKKAALAEFDGICSGDIIVMEAQEKLNPRLLPFIVNNDSFFDYAVETSAGSLSPRTKFQYLAEYEFLLPPKNQQEKIAQLLWSMDELIEKIHSANNALIQLYYTKLNQHFNHLKFSTEQLGKLLKSKPSYGANESAKMYNGYTRYIRITDIDEFGNLFDEKVSAEFSEDKYLLESSDLLLARSAEPGRSLLYKKHFGRCIHAGYLIKFPIDEFKVSPKYVFYFTKSRMFKNWINKTKRIGAQSNINSKEFLSVNVPICTLEKQNSIVLELDNILSEILNSKSHLKRSLKLSQSLLNTIFSVS